MSSQKKRKASIGDPAPAQQKARKEVSRQEPAESESGEENALQESISSSKGTRKAKPKKMPKNLPKLPSEGEEVDKGEGPSNTKYVFTLSGMRLQFMVIPSGRKSSRLRREPSKYKDYITPVKKQKEGEGKVIKGGNKKAAKK